MIKQREYTTKLAAGTGAIEETITLLDEWQDGMSASELLKATLESGRLSSISARRLKNIVLECFGHRYIIRDGYPAEILKRLKDRMARQAFLQVLFLFATRANPMIRDFVVEVYWLLYAGGRREISNEDARLFVVAANSDAKTTSYWSESTISRQSGYLTRVCADFGFLERGSKPVRAIESFRVHRQTVAFLAYDLHLSGIGDNAVILADDWRVFGLDEAAVHEEIAALSRVGTLVYQRAGESVRIGWAHTSWDEVIDGIAHI